MQGFILTRTAKDGTKRYDACWRVNGRQKSKTFTRRKPAEHFLTDLVKKLHEGTYVEITPTTFQAFAERWIEGLHDLKPSTRDSYHSILWHSLIPAFGPRVLSTLTVEDVNAWVREAEARGRRVKTLRNVLALLHKLLEDAREAGHIAINRLTNSSALRRPRVLRAEDETAIEILAPAEVNRLLDALPPAWAPLFHLAVSTGVRLGELLALQWGDLDATMGRLTVRRSAYRGVFYVPKTKRSRRTIDLGDQILGVLSRWRRERYGDPAPPSDALLFPDPTGRPLDPNWLRRVVWYPTLSAAGLRRVRIHSLRHTYASLLIAQGESIKYVSAQLGHASVVITLDRYGHLFPDEKRSAATRLEAQLLAAGSSSSHPADPAGAARVSGNTVEDGTAQPRARTD